MADRRAESRYALVRVSVTIQQGGHYGVRVAMKASAQSWADIVEVRAIRGQWSDRTRLPASEEEAAEWAVHALRQAYPGLF